MPASTAKGIIIIIVFERLFYTSGVYWASAAVAIAGPHNAFGCSCSGIDHLQPLKVLPPLGLAVDRPLAPSFISFVSVLVVGLFGRTARCLSLRLALKCSLAVRRTIACSYLVLFCSWRIIRFKIAKALFLLKALIYSRYKHCITLDAPLFSVLFFLAGNRSISCIRTALNGTD